MANVRAFQAIGEALRSYLSTTYPESLRADFPCSFDVVSTGQLAEFEDPSGDATVACTLFLYHSTISEQLRNTFQVGRTPTPTQPALPLELHWMLSVWSSSAAAEQVVYAWVLRQISQQPLLDATMLTEAEFSPSEVVQIVPEELPIEDLMRIWEAVTPSYRLSTTYVTRVVRLDVEQETAPVMISTELTVQARGPGDMSGGLS